MNNLFKKVFFISASLSLITIAFVISYYFLVFLPQKEQAREATIKKIEQKISNTENDTDNAQPALDTSGIENSVDDLRDSIEQQNADMEYEQRRRSLCEQGGGVYYGNGSCVTSNN